MNLNLKLRHKIQLIIISLSVVIFLGAIGYISIKARKAAYRDASRLVDFQSQKYANRIQGLMNSDFTVVRTLSQAFKTYDYLPRERWQEMINKMYIDVFQANPSFYNLWDSWELQYIDTSWTRSYGRISNQNFRENGEFKTSTDRRSLEGDPDLYASWKSRKEELVADLYADVFVENKSERRLMTTLASPILESGNFIGLVGVDLTLDRFQQIIQEIDIEKLEGCSSFLLTHNGKYAGHPDQELLNTRAPANPTAEQGFNLYDKMEQGKAFSILHQPAEERDKQESYVSYAPIQIGNTETQWYLGLSAPVSSIKAQANKNFTISLIVGLVGLLILSLVIYLVSRNITHPVEQVTDRLNRLSRGHIDPNMKLQLSTGDEIQEMATALNTSIDELNKKNEFAQKIGNGELEADYQMLSDDDQLGQSLIDMRNSLKQARREEEKRKIEDEKRRWVNEGLARFADILRQNNDNLEQLSYQIISNLVGYLGANQGGLFLLNDEDEQNIFYELKAAHAFNRKKYMEKEIKPGEGLVGSCAIEKQTIYMTDIPQDYIQITSGLGDANPDSLLIVPLKVEEEVLGVIEIASFKEFEKHQIEFVEKVAESIASTISSVRVNLRTSQLLEKSQQQAEEMSAQEEEMRQNMEELKATQEEAARRENELSGIMEAIDQFLIKAELDLSGKLINANPLFLETFGYDDQKIQEIPMEKFIDDNDLATFHHTWEEAKKGRDIRQKIRYINKHGTTLWLITSFSAVKDKEGNINKIIFIALDHTESENEKQQLKDKLNQREN
ncbi:MAG: GAF domain-containing protein [Bacteroidales bacterium]|nr:GAF domain-containing protein [Bacteroidales bacterium]